ncbi:hypothetical protein CNR22_16125 [Sphingobacteriaceae bacterium]|nr:hypothetical protein CNR22_16125 [Sphingobacteriaceae bacterium]
MTRRIYILIIIFFWTIKLFGQGNIKLSATDSISLLDTWTKYSKYLTDKNILEIKNNSLPLIHCIPCTMRDTPATNYVVPVDSFINSFYSWFKDSKLETVIKADEKDIFGFLSKEHQPKNVSQKTEESFILYEIFFFTFKPNEISPRHEGGGHIFLFIKKDNRFLFYGFDTNP